MSAKNVDKYNRFRSITVAFRVSPEEQKELNRAIALSGLPKQEYCYRKCMEREVVVQPNPRVYKALKTQMEFILNELQRKDNQRFSKTPGISMPSVLTQPDISSCIQPLRLLRNLVGNLLSELANPSLSMIYIQIGLSCILVTLSLRFLMNKA